MISSRADTLCVGWASTGMPRPLSATETLPSGWMVIRMRSQWPARASSTELSTISVDQVVQPPDVGAADEHARAAPDRLEPLEDLDVRGVVAVAPGSRAVEGRSWRGRSVVANAVTSYVQLRGASRRGTLERGTAPPGPGAGHVGRIRF